MTKQYTQVVASALPFPPVSWWQKAVQAGTLLLDGQEHYQKMSYRNRYYLADKKGKSLLSIPLTNGRNQRIAVDMVGISYAEDWQKIHWRTLQTLLGNAPFFEYIDYQLFPFFEKKEDSLFAWNKATILWANQFLGSPLDIKTTDSYIADYGDAVLDLRSSVQPKEEAYQGAAYYQVFSDDTGFLPDCSILDLICCEGKNAINFLR